MVAPSEPAPPVPSPRSASERVRDRGSAAGASADRPGGVSRPARRFIICGDTPLAYRIAEELTTRYRAAVTVLLTDRRGGQAPLIVRLPGVHAEIVPQVDAAAFRQANLTTTDAVALVANDDISNLYAALQAQDTCPGVRLVLRVFNTTLGQGLAQLFDNAQLLSDVEIAVPAFVAACLGTTEPTEVRVGDLVARVTTRAELADGDQVWCGLAIINGPGGLRLLPAGAEDADLVLASSPPAEATPVLDLMTLRRYRQRRAIVPRPLGAAFRATLRSIGALRPGIPSSPTAANDPPAPAQRPLLRARRIGRSAARRTGSVIRSLPSRFLPGRMSRGVRNALLVMLAVIAVGIAAYAVLGTDSRHSTWYTVYFMLLTAVGGANPDDTISLPLQILQTIVTFTGVALIPVASAAIVQASVPALARERVTARNHVVVVGLGNVGTRVLRTLHERGFPVVAIDHDEQPYGGQYVREQRISFIVGDESRESTLRKANIAHAAAMIVMTSDDVVNLEYALQGRSVRSNLRVVLRLFDGEFADRVNDVFNVTISRSVSYLAASAFAAGMVGREVIGTIPVRRRVLLVADVPVVAGSRLVGRTPRSFDVTGKSRVIAIVDASGRPTVCPPEERALSVGDRLVVVSTRSGLSQLVEESAPALGPPRPGALPVES